MGVQVTKELFKVSQVIGEACQQVIVEGTVNVPNGKPNIERVISVDAQLNSASVETDVLDGKVVVEGEIEVKVMYVADVPDGDQPVHFMERTIRFSNFVKVPGAKPDDMTVRVKAEIEHIQFDVAGPRAADVRLIVELCAKVTEVVQVEIVTDVTGPADLQVLRRTLRLEDVIGEDHNQVIIKNDVAVPDEKPNIEEIISVEARVEESEVKIIPNKVIVEGTLFVGILYVAAVEPPAALQPVHFMEARVPFTTFVEVPGAEEGMSVFVRFEIEAARGRRKNDRTVTVEAVLDTFVKVTKTQEIEVVVDVFSPSEQLEVHKRTLKVTQVIGEDTAQVVVRDTLTVPNGKPDIEQIYNVKADVSIDETDIIADKVIIEGSIDVETLYVALMEAAPLQPVHFMEHTINFTQFVEIPGATEDMDVDVNAVIEHIAFERVDERTFEVTFVIALTARVIEVIEIEVVVDVIEHEEVIPPGPPMNGDDPTPSMTIYIIQRGDTLWKIAKRYNTTVDAVINANNIQNPDMLMPGQQIVIPRYRGH
jgi:nucleoid-associated protein YgaU